MTPFATALSERIAAQNSRVCLGIDPRASAHPLTEPARFGNDPAQTAKAVVYYFQAIIEATHDLVACYKLQSAFFEALGIPGLIAMAQLLADVKARAVPVILDAKRGDIGATAEAYAQAYLADGVFAADALTVNPYVGMDGLEPFIRQARRAGRGLFVLIKTSNPGSGDVQDVVTETGEPLYERLSQLLTQNADPPDERGYDLLGAVVGATYPRELARLRSLLPHSVLLVPGYGAQGGTAQNVVHAFDEYGFGAVISSSRGLTYLTQDDDFAARSRQATETMRDTLNEAIEAR